MAFHRSPSVQRLLSFISPALLDAVARRWLAFLGRLPLAFQHLPSIARARPTAIVDSLVHSPLPRHCM